MNIERTISCNNTVKLNCQAYNAMFTYRSFSWPEHSEGDGPSSEERSIFPGSLTQNLQFAMVNALFSAFKLILCLLCRAQLPERLYLS